MAVSTNAGLGMGGGVAGFDWGSLMSNPMVIQMMSKMGASLDPEGPAGAMDQVTQGWIQNKSYLEMMKKMLGGGSKITFDKDTFSIKGPSNALSGNSMSMDQPAFSAGQPSTGGSLFK
jgi:hypothetical protein